MYDPNFTLEDAFKALKQIDNENDKAIRIPLKSKRSNKKINEGYSVDLNDNKQIESAKAVLKEKAEEPALEVIDIDADTLEHLKNKEDYVGQMIMKCKACQALKFMDAALLKEDPEQPSVFNLEDECPNCHAEGKGFEVVGQVGKVAEEKVVEDQPEEANLENDQKNSEDVAFDNDLEEEKPEEVAEVPEESEEIEQPEEPEVDNKIDADEEKAYDETDAEDDTEDLDIPDLGDVIDSDDIDADDTEEKDVKEALEDEELKAVPEEEISSKLNDIATEMKVAEETDEEEDEEEKEPILIENFFELFAEPEDIKKIRLIDTDGQTVFEDDFKSLTPILSEAELVGINPKGLIINVDSELEEGVDCQDIIEMLDLKDDDELANISIAVNEDEAKIDSLDDLKDIEGKISSIEPKGIVELIVASDKEFEAVKDEEQSEEDSLVQDIVKENYLSMDRINNMNSNEYWIRESILRKEDLDVIFESFVLSTDNKDLVKKFKKVTGFKDAIDEAREKIGYKVELVEEVVDKCDDETCPTCGKKISECDCKDCNHDKEPEELPVAESKEACRHCKNRKELADAINECKNNNQPFNVKRSETEGFRYDIISEAFFDDVEIKDVDDSEGVDPDDISDVIDPEDEISSTEIVPEGMSEEEIEISRKLMRVAKDTVDAIKDNYGYDVPPEFVVADMMQDLKLIGGAIRPDELTDTPINNITKQMFDGYNQFYQAMDEIMTFFTGEAVETTSEEKLAQAIRALDGPDFTTEAINKAISSDRFLTAAQAGAIPYIPAEEIRQLTGVNESMFGFSVQLNLELIYIIEQYLKDTNISFEEIADMTGKELAETSSFQDWVKYSDNAKNVESKNILAKNIIEVVSKGILQNGKAITIRKLFELKDDLYQSYKKDRDLNESLLESLKLDEASMSELKEIAEISKQIGIETLGDLDKFIKNEMDDEHKDKSLVDLLADYLKKLGPDFKLNEFLASKGKEVINEDEAEEIIDSEEEVESDEAVGEEPTAESEPELEPEEILEPEDEPEEDVEPATNEDDCVNATAIAVMGAYQNANKWLDSVKEVVYTNMNCPFFSSFIHELAHSMPARFDKFGDILHTVNMEIPYPATEEISSKPQNITEAFEVIFKVLDDIKATLNAFIKCTDDDKHGMSCAAEACLNDIEGEYPMLFRLQGKWNDCNGDTVDFDKYVMQYVEHKDNLLESLNEGKTAKKYNTYTELMWALSGGKLSKSPAGNLWMIPGPYEVEDVGIDPKTNDLIVYAESEEALEPAKEIASRFNKELISKGYDKNILGSKKFKGIIPISDADFEDGVFEESLASLGFKVLRKAFSEDINKYFKEAYTESVLFESSKAYKDEEGNIICEGFMHMEGVAPTDVKFTLKADGVVNESIGNGSYVVTNSLSDEVFKFTF